MSLSEINQKLTAKPYVDGFVPSKADAELFTELFGNNQNVIAWASRMAAYFEAERNTIAGTKPKAAAAPAKAAAAPAKAAAPADDDLDLFGDVSAEEQAALDAKKAADKDSKKKEKKAVIQKSNILIDIKPWDDQVDLEALWAKYQAIERDGLVWGSHRLNPIAFGLKKLTIMIVIEDDKITGDEIEEMLMQFEDEVQSMDIQAWNKI
eukprot:PhM_4_TR3811/c0_g1_i2/m.92011/K03232/EEF1B; elongation factor 1-beta